MIKLKEFLSLYNFRRIDEERMDFNKYDTDIVRIIYGDSMNDYFEFGIYDFGGDTEKRIARVLSKELLDCPVDSFRVSDETLVINIDTVIGVYKEKDEE